MAKQPELRFFAGGIVDENNIGQVLKALFVGGAERLEIAPVWPQDTAPLTNGKIATPKIAGLLPPPERFAGKAERVIYGLLQEHPIITGAIRTKALREAGLHENNTRAILGLIEAGYAKPGDKRGEHISLIYGKGEMAGTANGAAEPNGPGKGRGGRILYAMLKHSQTITNKQLSDRLERVGMHKGNAGSLLEKALVDGWCKRGHARGEYTSLIAGGAAPKKPKQRRKEFGVDKAVEVIKELAGQKGAETFRTAEVMEHMEKQHFGRTTVQRALAVLTKQKILKRPLGRGTLQFL